MNKQKIIIIIISVLALFSVAIWFIGSNIAKEDEKITALKIDISNQYETDKENFNELKNDFLDSVNVDSEIETLYDEYIAQDNFDEEVLLTAVSKSDSTLDETKTVAIQEFIRQNKEEFTKREKLLSDKIEAYNDYIENESPLTTFIMDHAPHSIDMYDVAKNNN